MIFLKAHKILAISILAVILIGITCFIALRKGTEGKVEYNTAPVSMGLIQETVSSTGTLNAVQAVDVSTQISGTIASWKVDYNDKVKKNQIVAVLDLTQLKEALAQAAADLAKARVLAEHSAVDFKRNQKLWADGHIAEKDLLDSKATAQEDSVAVISAQANMDRANTNLELGTIRSPINGTVISRNIELGQTVAASLSSPTLFVIAEDLTRMQILANVDESDIGQIKVGQKVSYTVQAYPDSIFWGKVTQIRMNPTTLQNVVNYTVVVDAPNPHLTLLPGMTATAEFITATSDSTMIVPNSALSFKGPEQHKSSTAKPDSLKNKWHHDSTGTNAGASAEANHGRVWVLLPDGSLEQRHMLLGLTDGARTAVLKSRDLKVGDLLVTSIKTVAEKKQKTLFDAASHGQGNHGPGGPGGGMR